MKTRPLKALNPSRSPEHSAGALYQPGRRDRSFVEARRGPASNAEAWPWGFRKLWASGSRASGFRGSWPDPLLKELGYFSGLYGLESVNFRAGVWGVCPSLPLCPLPRLQRKVVRAVVPLAFLLSLLPLGFTVVGCCGGLGSGDFWRGIR